MIYERDIAILQKLLRATMAKTIHWEEEENGWYTSTIGGRRVCFRFLYFEAENQVGADPHTLQLHMPGRNAKFACGTEGFDILMELLAHAFVDWDTSGGLDPLQFLDEALPE